MMSSLFPPELYTVSDIMASDFAFFGRCLPMCDMCDVVRTFPRGSKPFAWADMTYQSIIRDRRYRAMVVTLDSDRVLVVFKYIIMGHVRQVRVIGLPRSGYSDDESIQIVVHALLSRPFVKIAFGESDSSLMLGVKYDRLMEYDDYYIDLDHSLYGSSKFRSRHYINKMLANVDILVTRDVSLLGVMELRRRWVEGMTRRGHAVTTSNDAVFDKMMHTTDSRVERLFLRYKDVVVTSMFFILSDDGDYADCITINHLWDDYGDAVLGMLNKNIVAIQKWMMYTCLPLGVRRVYFGGCRSGNHRLLRHKQSIYGKKISWYITESQK